MVLLFFPSSPLLLYISQCLPTWLGHPSSCPLLSRLLSWAPTPKARAAPQSTVYKSSYQHQIYSSAKPNTPNMFKGSLITNKAYVELVEDPVQLQCCSHACLNLNKLEVLSRTTQTFVCSLFSSQLLTQRADG